MTEDGELEPTWYPYKTGKAHRLERSISKGGTKEEDETISIEQSSFHSFRLVSYDHNVTMKATSKLQIGAVSYDPGLQSWMTNHKKNKTKDNRAFCAVWFWHASSWCDT
jgi:hypothetical protein